jgi:hypothetical protein
MILEESIKSGEKTTITNRFLRSYIPEESSVNSKDYSTKDKIAMHRRLWQW